MSTHYVGRGTKQTYITFVPKLCWLPRNCRFKQFKVLLKLLTWDLWAAVAEFCVSAKNRPEKVPPDGSTSVPPPPAEISPRALKLDYDVSWGCWIHFKTRDSEILQQAKERRHATAKRAALSSVHSTREHGPWTRPVNTGVIFEEPWTRAIEIGKHYC